MLPWLFNTFMNDVLREARVMFGKRSVRMVKNSAVKLLTLLMFADALVLMAECEVGL